MANKPAEKKSQRYVVIALAALIAFVMIALGVLAIWGGHYVGKARNSVLVSVEGLSAQWLGAFRICIGMLVLSIAMPSRTIALRWAIAWGVLAVASVVLALHYR